VAGALTERDFVRKLEKAQFTDVEVMARDEVSIDDCALYPLFTDELLSLMRRLLSAAKQRRVATAVVFRARVPG
jgi:hypothetical protein